MKVLIIAIVVVVAGATTFMVVNKKEPCEAWNDDVTEFSKRPPVPADYIGERPDFTQEEIDTWFEDYRELERQRPEGCEYDHPGIPGSDR